MIRLLCMLLVILLGASYGSPMFIAVNPTSCPLDFGILNQVDVNFNQSDITAFRCKLILNALDLVLEEYFKRTGLFLPSIEHCLSRLQPYFPDIDIGSQCAAWDAWMAEEECMSIHTREEFETVVPHSIRTDLSHVCHMVKNLSSCSICRSMISNFQLRYLHHNYSCAQFLKIYVMASSTPVDQDTVQCLLSLHIERILSHRENFVGQLATSIVGGFLLCLLVASLIYVGLSRHKKKRMRWRELELAHSPTRTEQHTEALGVVGSGVTPEHVFQESEEGDPLGNIDMSLELDVPPEHTDPVSLMSGPLDAISLAPQGDAQSLAPVEDTEEDMMEISEGNAQSLVVAPVEDTEGDMTEISEGDVQSLVVAPVEDTEGDMTEISEEEDTPEGTVPAPEVHAPLDHTTATSPASGPSDQAILAFQGDASTTIITPIKDVGGTSVETPLEVRLELIATEDIALDSTIVRLISGLPELKEGEESFPESMASEDV